MVDDHDAPREPPANGPFASGDARGPDLWVWFARIGAQTALLTALLFYFGWIRSKATYDYFGVDTSLLEFSTSDFVLRSVNSIFQPLLIIGVGTLAVTLAQDEFSDPAFSKSHPRLVRTAARIPLVVGLALVAAAYAGWVVGLSWHWLPFALPIGFALLRFAVARPVSAGMTTDDLSVRGGKLRTVLTALALASAFWAVSAFATHTGETRAKGLVQDLQSSPSVLVYSNAPLALSGPGVRQEKLDPSASYRWRYDGLRLLVRSGKRYFLLPRGWKRGQSSVYVLAETSGLRFELRTS